MKIKILQRNIVKNKSNKSSSSKASYKSSLSKSYSSKSKSYVSKFAYYPEISDDDFYERIYTKKEFHNFLVKDRPKADKSVCNPKEFIPKPHQQFLRNFISPDTPYNGILLVHGTGSGKTCTAITIAENFKELVKKMDKKIIVITTLPKNFQKELYSERKELKKQSPEDIVQCTGRDYELGIESKSLTREQKRKEIMKKIYNYYKFYGYKEFANDIMKNTNYWKGDEETLNDSIRNYISKNFDNTILIIDEVQNIKTDVSGDLKKSIQPLLKSIIKYAKNLKLILMSATPMFDRQDEIIYLMNLLLINDGKEEIEKDDIFNKDQTLKDGASEKLREVFKGYISYIRGENPDSFPMKFFPSNAITNPPIEYDMGGNKIDKTKKIQYTPIVLCPMSGIQHNTYMNQLEKITKEGKLKSKEEEMNTEEDFNSGEEEGETSSLSTESKSTSKSTSNSNEVNGSMERNLGKNVELVNQGGMSIYRDLLNISNIVFPVEDSEIGTYDKKGYSESDDGSGGFYKVKKEGKKRSIVKFRYQSHAIFDKDTKGEAPFLDAQHLNNYSAKFSQTLDSIVNSVGLNYVYSTYIDSGALPFALMLEQNGFERYTTDTETELLEYPPNKVGGGGKRLRICYKCGKQANHENHTNTKLKEHHLFRVAKYILYFGESRDGLIKVQKEDAVAQFISPNNRYGEEIKVFIGTRATSEGLDFKMIRQIHILQPWYNLSRHEQIIGRGIRSCSHIELPPEERNVSIYQYAVTEGVKSKNETVDLYYYRIAENKDIIIKKIMRIMKESAIDCNFFKKQNVILDESEKVDQKLPNGKVIKVTFADKAYSSMCDYMGNCDYPCNWVPNPKKKYVIDEDTYNIYFGKQNIEEAKRYIKELFHYGFNFILKDIESYFKTRAPHIESIFIYKALDELVDNKNEIILDMYKRKGYLIYRGNHYIYQPFDYEREDILMMYRKLPQPHFPSKVDLDKYTYNYEPREIKEGKNETRNLNVVNQTKIYNNVIKNIMKIKDTYSFIDPSLSEHFLYSIINMTMDKLISREYHYFIQILINNIHNDNLDDLGKTIIDCINQKLIYFHRDVQTSNNYKLKKENILNKKSIIGYVYDNLYYVLENVNENSTKIMIKKNSNKAGELRFTLASKDLSYKIEKMRELQSRESKNETSQVNKRPKNIIYGKMEWDKKKERRLFMIVDKSIEENIKTKQGKKSGRATIKGMVCKSFGIPRLKNEIWKKLGIPESKGPKEGIDFLCTAIELYLRYKQEKEKKNMNGKVYFQR